VHRAEFEGTAGLNQTVLQVAALARGTYSLQILGDDCKIVKKIVLQP
jgi:hypothetical protein